LSEAAARVEWGLGDKIYPLRMKHYGDPTAEQKVLDKRSENAHSLP
jgi:hypothetical protein